MLRMDRLRIYAYRFAIMRSRSYLPMHSMWQDRSLASREATPSLPADLQIGLRERELPAGIFLGIMMRVTGAGTEPALSLAMQGDEIRYSPSAGGG